MVEQPHLRYEDAAHQVTVTGWACVKCNRFYGAGTNAEHAARWCCCDSRPCEACKTNRTHKHFLLCNSCREAKGNEKWQELVKTKQVEWDGKFPLAQYDSGTFYWDQSDLDDAIDDVLADGGTTDDLRLVTCEPASARSFSMIDHLEEVLPEDGDLNCATIDKQVNDWIAAHSPISWRATDVPVKVNTPA